MTRIVLLVLAALCAAPLHAQTIEKVIPLGSVGADLAAPLFLAFDSSSNSVYVADERGYSALAIDCSTHERAAYIPVASDWCYGLVAAVGCDRVYHIGETLVSAIDTKTFAVTREIGTRYDCWFSGGGYNPLTEKVYCMFEDSAFVLEGRSGEILKRLQVGYMDDVEGPLPFAVNTRHNKVYLYVAEDETGWSGILALDGNADTVLARIDVGDYMFAMCYDEVNDLLWCPVESTTYRLVAIDGTTDSVVAYVPLGQDLGLADVCFDRTNSKVYCLSDAGSLISVDAGTRRTLGTTYIGESDFPKMCVNERDCKLYCASDGRIVVLDTRSDMWLTEFAGFDCPVAPTWNAQADEVYWLDYAGARMAVADGTDDSLTAVVGTYSVPHSPCFDRDRQRIFLAGPEPDEVRVVDCLGDTVTARASLGLDINSLYWNPAGQRLFAADESESAVAVLDPTTMKVVSHLPVNGPDRLFGDTRDNEVYCPNPSSDELTILSGDGVRVTDTVLVGLKPDEAYIDTLASRLYAMEDFGGSIAVFDCSTDKVVARIAQARGYGHFLAGVAGERRLYCSISRTLYIFDTHVNRLVKTMTSEDWPSAACYDPIDRRVFCSYWSGSLSLLDPAADTIMGRLTLPDRVRTAGYNQASGSVYWVGDTLVGFVNARTLELTKTLCIPDLCDIAVCDESRNRLYFFSMSAIYVVKDEEPTSYILSETGPALVGRTVTLCGTEDASLLDITGRRVGVLHPGSNQLTGLVPGAYFLVRRGRGGIQKVILPR